MALVGVTPAVRQRWGDAAITAQLQAASSIADSYLSSQYTLPLKTSPQGWDMSLTMAVCNIAAYLLYCQYGFNPGSSQPDKLIQLRYDDAIKWFAQIRDEEVHPQWVDSSTTVPEAGPYVISDPPVGFTGRGVVNGVCGNPWGWSW